MDEIAEYLGPAEDFIYTGVTKGMPGLKVGRLWKFKKEDVDVWVREGGAGRNPLRGADKTGLKAGAVLGKRKMAKHFDLAITAASFTYSRNEASIQKDSTASMSCGPACPLRRWIALPLS